MVNLSVMIISDKWLILWYFNFENVQISIIKILLFYFFYGLLCVNFDVLIMISVGHLLKLLLFQLKLLNVVRVQKCYFRIRVIYTLLSTP